VFSLLFFPLILSAFIQDSRLWILPLSVKQLHSLPELLNLSPISLFDLVCLNRKVCFFLNCSFPSLRHLFYLVTVNKEESKSLTLPLSNSVSFPNFIAWTSGAWTIVFLTILSQGKLMNLFLNGAAFFLLMNQVLKDSLFILLALSLTIFPWVIVCSLPLFPVRKMRILLHLYNSVSPFHFLPLVNYLSPSYSLTDLSPELRNNLFIYLPRKGILNSLAALKDSTERCILLPLSLSSSWTSLRQVKTKARFMELLSSSSLIALPLSLSVSCLCRLGPGELFSLRK